ncbi:cation transport ATPase [Rhizobium leguminosarum]
MPLFIVAIFRAKFPKTAALCERLAPLVSAAALVYTIVAFTAALTLLAVSVSVVFADQLAAFLRLVVDLVLWFWGQICDFFQAIVRWFLDRVLWISGLLGLIALIRLAYGLAVFINGLWKDDRVAMLRGLKASNALLFYSAYAGIVFLLLRTDTGYDPALSRRLFWAELWTFFAFSCMLVVLAVCSHEIVQRRRRSARRKVSAKTYSLRR